MIPSNMNIDISVESIRKNKKRLAPSDLYDVFNKKYTNDILQTFEKTPSAFDPSHYSFTGHIDGRNITVVPIGALAAHENNIVNNPLLKILAENLESWANATTELIIPLVQEGLRKHWTILHFVNTDKNTINVTLYDSKNTILAKLWPVGYIEKIIRDHYKGKIIQFNTVYLGNQGAFNQYECGYWTAIYMRELIKFGAIKSPSELKVDGSRSRIEFWKNVAITILSTIAIAAIITAGIYFTGGLALIPLITGMSVIPQLLAVFTSVAVGLSLFTSVVLPYLIIKPLAGIINFFSYRSKATNTKGAAPSSSNNPANDDASNAESSSANDLEGFTHIEGNPSIDYKEKPEENNQHQQADGEETLPATHSNNQ